MEITRLILTLVIASIAWFKCGDVFNIHYKKYADILGFIFLIIAIACNIFM